MHIKLLKKTITVKTGEATNDLIFNKNSHKVVRSYGHKITSYPDALSQSEEKSMEIPKEDIYLQKRQHIINEL